MLPITVRIILLALFSLLATTLCAQQNTIDSLEALLSAPMADTTRIKTLNALAWELKYTNPDTAILLSTQALELANSLPPSFFKEGAGGWSANSHRNLGVFNRLKGNYPQALLHYDKALEINERLNDKPGTAATLGSIGIIYWNQGDYPKALSHYFRALEIDSVLGNKSRIATHLGNIGGVYWNQGDYPKALSHYFRALEIDSVLGNKREIARHLGNIGLVYKNQGDYPKALSYYFRALETDSVLGNKRGMAIRLGNIGNVYDEQGEAHPNPSPKEGLYNKALSHYFRAYEIDSVLGNKNGMAIWLGNIGNVYDEQGEAHPNPSPKEGLYNKALSHYFRAYEIDSVLGNKKGIAIRLGNIGSLYTKTKNYQKAEEYLQRSLSLSNSIGTLNYTMIFEKSISELYVQTNRYQKAHEHHLAFQVANDSIFNEEKSKDIGREEMKFEMKMAEIKKKQEEETVAAALAASIKKRDLLHTSLILLILATLTLLVFYSRRLTARLPEKIFGRDINKAAVALGLLWVTLLLFFETAMVYIDPYTGLITEGAPVYVVFINGILGCSMFPLYSFLERKLQGKFNRQSAKGNGQKTIGKIIPFLALALLHSSFTGNKSSGEHSRTTDSLKNVLTTATHDTTKINALLQIAEYYSYQDPDSAILYALQAKQLAEKIKDSRRIARALMELGWDNYVLGNYPQALLHYDKSLEINEWLNDKPATAAGLGSIGIVYDEQGDYPKALSHYFRALEIDSVLGDKSGMAADLGNIGLVYWNQGDYPKALSHYFRALEIDSVLGDKSGMAADLGNIGIVYMEQGDYPKALSHYFHALEIDSVLGNKSRIAAHLGNIGIVYYKQRNYPKSLSHYFRALEIDSVLGNKSRIAAWLSNIGNVYKEQGDYSKALSHYFHALETDSVLGNKKGMAIRLGNIGSLYTGMMKSASAIEKSVLANKAEEYLQRGQALSDSIGTLLYTMDFEKNISDLYIQTGRYKEAYTHDTLYSAARTKLFNEEKSKEIGRVEMKFEIEMGEYVREQEMKRQINKSRIAIERRDKMQYSALVIGIFLSLGIVFFFAGFYLPGWLLELSVFMPFLLLFEALLAFLEPTLQAITGGAPLWIMVINALLAVVIYPVHNYLEGMLKRRVGSKHLTSAICNQALNS